MDRSKVAEKEACNETLRKLTPYQMGMQVPCGLDPEMSEESSIGAASEGSGTNGWTGVIVDMGEEHGS